MTQDQIKLVKKSWRSLMGINPAVIGDAFYSKLFTDNPGIRKLFPDDMEKQYVKLVDMLNSIVVSIDHDPKMTEELMAMGQRHVTYKVKPQHYQLVGAALVWTLEKALGAEWNQKLEDAWVACYNHIAEIMQRSAQRV
jgi:hemoglobin-like flavoprotein